MSHTDESIRSFMIARAVVIGIVTLIVAGLAICGVLRHLYDADLKAPAPEDSKVADTLGRDEGEAIPREHRILPLARAIPLPRSKKTIDQIFDEWDTFEHEPYETAGFNHLTLPFHFVNENGEVNQREGFAFSFLLSNALDWTPGCYCSRHAFFVFKRSREAMLSASVRYDHNLIKPLMEQWGSTHTLGGEITKVADGYSGRLKIYDREGVLSVEKEYAEPVAYFDLLGAMSVDAMKYFGHEPNEALVKHLYEPRCEHHESIVDLGRAAFAEERSNEEFELYKKILERDPDFAEVRYWAANQLYWKHNHRGAYELQKALSLDSYLTEAALSDSLPHLCPDQELAGMYEDWMSTAEALVGPDSPFVLALRLKHELHSGPPRPELAESAARSAAAYPNGFTLRAALTQVLMHRAHGIADPDLLAGIASAAGRSRYMPGTARAHYAMNACVVDALLQLGRHGSAVAVARQAVKSDAIEDARGEGVANPHAFHQEQLAAALRAAGRYGESLEVRMRMLDETVSAGQPCSRQAYEAGVCAAHDEQPEVLGEVLSVQGISSTVRHLLESYLQILEGKTLGDEEIDTLNYIATTSEWSNREVTVLFAQVDIMAGRDAYRDQLVYLLEMRPNDRELWILFDAYDSARPRSDSEDFYGSLEWLHGHDPWVRGAVVAREARWQEASIAADAAIEEKLNIYEPIQWPRLSYELSDISRPRGIAFGSVAVVVRELLAHGEFKKAKDLSLRYGGYALHARRPSQKRTKGFLLRAYCSHLYNLASRAEALEVRE